ncbi:MAG: hypothetical protein M3R62_13610 [Acidobacteriota bacterium]|nr:hypothetical protein [Acidobacteriota bacterium]
MLSSTLRRSVRLLLVLAVVGLPFGLLFYFVAPSRGKVGVMFVFLLVVYFASHRLWPGPDSGVQSRGGR